MISGNDGSADGAGPRILVFIGRMAMLPACLIDGSSLNEEWYAGITLLSL